jgi:hypothetical protein
MKYITDVSKPSMTLVPDIREMADGVIPFEDIDNFSKIECVILNYTYNFINVEYAQEAVGITKTELEDLRAKNPSFSKLLTIVGKLGVQLAVRSKILNTALNGEVSTTVKGNGDIITVTKDSVPAMKLAAEMLGMVAGEEEVAARTAAKTVVKITDQNLLNQLHDKTLEDISK